MEATAESVESLSQVSAVLRAPRFFSAQRVAGAARREGVSRSASSWPKLRRALWSTPSGCGWRSPIISNAIKYTRDGGTIIVRLAGKDGQVRWMIHDSGIGISKAAQLRLFENFYRADNAMETEGTGLGLHMVRLIVEQFGGTGRGRRAALPRLLMVVQISPRLGKLPDLDQTPPLNSRISLGQSEHDQPGFFTFPI
jgi:hypothetical protein